MNCGKNSVEQFRAIVLPKYFDRASPIGAERALRDDVQELLSYWLRNSKLPTDIPVTVATWAIYGLASHYSHLKKRPALNKFVEQALPLVAVNLEQFAQSV